MADACHAARQDVQQESAGELSDLEGHRFDLIAVTVVAPQERHTTAIKALDALVADRGAVGVATQVADQVLGPGKGRFDVEAPGLLVQRCQPTIEGSIVLQMGQCPTEPEFTVQGLEPIQIAPAKPVA